MATWLITGCSTGLGYALAAAVLDHGDNAVVTARDVAKVRNLVGPHPDTGVGLSLDITDAAQVASAVRAAEESFGGVDVLVNNAGYGYRAAVEEGEDADVQQLLATNFLGPVAMIKAVLPAMRARRSGAIVNISSMVVRVTSAGWGYYAAQAIIAAVESPDTPALLVLGQDCLDNSRRTLDAQRAELEAWAKLSASTGFDD